MGRRSEYQPKGGDALRLGVKAGMVRVCVVWRVKLCDPIVTHESYLSTLEIGHNKALYRSILYFTVTVMQYEVLV